MYTLAEDGQLEKVTNYFKIVKPKPKHYNGSLLELLSVFFSAQGTFTPQTKRKSI
jgi:hypothetical protein